MKDHPLVWGHRGARWDVPENTCEGIRFALDGGVSHFEIDVAVTADGVPVVHHDACLSPDITRNPQGEWLTATGPLLQEVSWNTLQGFDVGRIQPRSPMDRRFPEQTPIDGACIPTLESVLRMPARHFLVELKLFPDHREWTVSPQLMVDKVIHAARQARALDRITVQSFDWRAVRYCRTAYPDMPTALLTEAKTAAASELWWGVASTHASIPLAIAAEGVKTWSASAETLLEAEVEQAHALGLKVVAWTVNEPQQMLRLARWGVDGLITDRPVLCQRILDGAT